MYNAKLNNFSAHFLIINQNLTYVSFAYVVKQIKSSISSSRPRVFLNISTFSEQNTPAGVSFLIKLQIGGLQTYWKETLA